jgi:translation initiation factor IF-3
LRYRKKPQSKRTFINYQIRAKEVRVVDETGKQLGIMPLEKALQTAKERNLDLIQVTEKVAPPVCKLGDFGKFLYSLKKKSRLAKSKAGELKKIRLSFKISDHDLETKAKQSEKFLKKGNKVMIEMQLKGREKSLREFAKEKIEKFLQKINESIPIKIERELKKQPRGLTVIISRK